MDLLEKDIQHNLGEEIRRDIDKAFDLYRAMSSRTWTWEGAEYSWTSKEAGAAVARIRVASGCPHETYLDYIGQEGEPSSWILKRAGYLGYQISSRTSAR